MVDVHASLARSNWRPPPRWVQALRRLDLHLLLWFVPLGVAMVLLVLGPRLGESLLTLGIGGSLALGVLIVAARRPAVSLAVLVAFLPFDVVVFSYLYKLGLPASMFGALRGWQELLAIAVVIAGNRARRDRGEGFDGLSRIVLLYVGFAAAYVFVPQLAIHGWNETARMVEAQFGAFALFRERLFDWRDNVMFLLLLLGAYWCRFTRAELTRIAKIVVVAGALTAVVGLYEWVDQEGWNRFALETIGVRDYEREVLGLFVSPTKEVTASSLVAGREVARIVSVYFSPLDTGFALVLPFAIGLERLLRAGRNLPALAVTAVALLLTQTRAAIIAAAVAAALALRPLPGRRRDARVRIAFALAAGILFISPLAVSSGFTDRVTAAVEGTDESSQSHWDRSYAGLKQVLAAPLGLGIGAVATTYGMPQAQTLGPGNQLIPENYYLQVGLETGIASMLLFVAVAVAVVRRLRRADRAGPMEVAAATGTMIGLSLGALLLHTWGSIEVSWTAWSFAGAALGCAAAARDDDPYDRDALRRRGTLAA